MDLIFVHGLGGHLEKSWRVKDQADSFWPRDWLHKEEALQNARVHTFGYPTTLTERDRKALDIEGISSLLLKCMDESGVVGDVGSTQYTCSLILSYMTRFLLSSLLIRWAG